MFGAKARKQLRVAQAQQIRDERMAHVLAGELPARTLEERLALRKKNKTDAQ